MVTQLSLLAQDTKKTSRSNVRSFPPAQKLNLRPYQKKVISEVYDLIRQGWKSPLIYAPTGAGKTLIASKITKDALSRDRRILFLVHRDPLVMQTVESLAEHGIDKDSIGFIKAGYPHACDQHKVIVASIQSIARRDFPKDIGLIIVDEAHTTSFFSTYKKIEETYLHDGRTGAITIGLSASPWRNKSTEYLGQHFDSIAIAATLPELIKDGYLAKPRYFAFGGFDDFSKLEIGEDGDFKRSQVERLTMAIGYCERIVSEFKKLCPDRTAIAFCSSVKQSQRLTELFNEAGIVCEHIDASTPAEERAKMYKRLESGETRILSSVGTLTEGFNVKSISAVILARPTRSHALFTQICGRGLRSFFNKKDCFLLDFGGNFHRLGYLSQQPKITLEPIKKNNVAPPTKECPNCGEEVYAMLQVCPNCGHEFISNPIEEDISEEEFLEAKFGELLDPETKTKVTYLRKQLKTRYSKQQPRDRAWALYVDKYNETPCNEWLEGAVFHGFATELNQQLFLDYLHQVSPINPPKPDWLKFHFKVEFGDRVIPSITPEQGMKWYEILQVSPQADWEMIKKNYRKLSQTYHPDIGGETEKMQLLNWAFDKAKSVNR